MGHRRIAITLPEDMAEAVDRACAAVDKSRSDLIRAALREYLAKRAIPEFEPTAAEAAIFERGEAEYRRGEHVPAEEVFRSSRGK